MKRRLIQLREAARNTLWAIVWMLPLGGQSLRRSVRKQLRPRRSVRLQRFRRRIGRLAGRAGWATYVALVAVIFFPWLDIDSGLLGKEADSEDYLQTLWQVVGAALGLSIAMIAFVFEAFMSASSRSLGGSLREFARTTRLEATLRFGFAALICDGAVLLGLGHEAPRGWAAMWAILLSAATLGIGLPFVFGRTIRALDFDYLIELRGRQIDGLVAVSMARQLETQVSDTIIHNTRALTGVSRELWLTAPQVGLVRKRGGVVRNIRLGRLSRLARTMQPPGRSAPIGVLKSLNESVGAGSAALAIPPHTSRSWRRAAMRTVRIGRRRYEDAVPDLLIEALDRLHDAAMTAIRDGRSADWSRIGTIYSRALLAMPRETARVNVTFTGAVAAPGLFGLGPLDRIERFLFAEVEAALTADNRELALEVAYFPAGVASDAARLNAPGLVRGMLRFYPRLYLKATS